MSRIGNKPIPVGNGVKITIDGRNIQVAGAKGSLAHVVPDMIHLEQNGSSLVVKRENDGRRAKSLHGLTRSLLANMVKGVETGFTKELEIHGVGYRAQVSGKKLVLNLGYSHPVEYEIPPNIEIKVNDNTKITIQGADRQRVGQVAAIIRDFKRPEPYKGKGIRYAGEYIAMKEGKTV